MSCAIVDKKPDVVTKLADYVIENMPPGWSLRLVFAADHEGKAILTDPNGNEYTDFYSVEDPGTVIDACRYASEYDE